MGDQMPQSEERLLQTRRALVDHFSAIPREADPLSLQEALATELGRSEAAADRNSESSRRHRRLLRIIGDSIAFTVLHDHTIRTLNRHPSSAAAGLSTQGDDFHFVLQVARKLADSGYIPVLNDVTNLLRIGDITAVSLEHVLVLECKNTPLPSGLPSAGRLARQRKRGSDAVQYLRTSRIVEADGIREAISIDLPGPDWTFLARLGRDLEPRQDGISAALLDDGDGLGLATIDPELKSFNALLKQLLHLVSANNPVIATSLDAIKDPSWSRPSPLTYPLPPWLRFALLENQVLMVRMIDADRLCGTEELTSGKVANLGVSARQGSAFTVSLDVGDKTYETDHALLDRVMYTPTRIEAFKHALLASADNLLAMSQAADPSSEAADRAEQRVSKAEDEVRLAPGDDIAYGTIYRSEHPTAHMVVYEPDHEDRGDISHVAWDADTQENVAFYRSGIRIDIDPADRRRLKELRLREAKPPVK